MKLTLAFVTSLFIAFVQAAPTPVEAREPEVDAEVPYLNGPDAYWARDVKARKPEVDAEVPYLNGPDAYWARSEKARDSEVNAEIPYLNGPDAYWVRDVKEVDSEVPYANGPNSYWYHPLRSLKLTIPTASTRTDFNGCVRLGAADLHLFVVFHDTKHHVFWDLNDEEYATCHARLYLLAKDTHKWDLASLSQPNISIIDIVCRVQPIHTAYGDYDPDVEYVVKYLGAMVRLEEGKEPTLTPELGINIDPIWNCISNIPSSLVHRTTSNNSKDTGGHAKCELIDGFANCSSRATVDVRGWFLDFWIPIPAKLFLKKETRLFDIQASVWMANEDPDTDELLDENELTSSREMSISHLRRERDLVY
ncbi:hypothetical protein BDQ12DRAFT_720231 [Crucibulum laeve]|uniref:Uncharacterized protein n=1 Tax=Crucibulum laeve TaxID=68775 RepID=A0A5C3MAC3_9AGAR|nr:hypothetical protein BDQ12DRAFT_720231 [Crucibulum laeve]